MFYFFGLLAAHPLLQDPSGTSAEKDMLESDTNYDNIVTFPFRPAEKSWKPVTARMVSHRSETDDGGCTTCPINFRPNAS